MTIVTLVRIAVWLTFIALIAGEIAGVVFTRRFIRHYFAKHRELEVRVEAIERRLQITEG